jgi:hypothetical protein
MAGKGGQAAIYAGQLQDFLYALHPLCCYPALVEGFN